MLFKRCFLMMIMSCFTMSLFASSYYFSSSKGNDANTNLQAQNKNSPWKSLQKLNDVIIDLKPGDSVLFKRGDIFYGQIIISSNNINSIVFDVYDEGKNPVISGFTNITKLNAAVNGIIQTDCAACSSDLKMVLINGMQQPPGRYPNGDASNGGYFNFESFVGNTSITDNQLNDSINWKDGQIVIRKTRWVLDRNLITQQNGHTIIYESQSGYSSSAGYGYFIQNHIKTLDKFGEWCVDETNKKLSVYSGNAGIQNIKVSSIDTLIYLNHTSNIVFNNIHFEGANSNCFEINNSQNIKLNSCSISYSGKNAINAANTMHLKVIKTSILYTNNNAINADCNYSLFQNDTIKYTGVFAGLGDGDAGSYEGVLLTGNNISFDKNIIDSTGYIPITFRGDSITITNNFIKDFTFIKDDGGGIYTWNNASDAVEHFGGIVKGNIILNGTGAPYGTNDKTYLPSNGIYIDDNAGNLQVSNNTVAHCAQYGIFMHNAHNCDIINNTVFDNATQLAMIHDNIAADKTVINNIIKQNIFFSKYQDQTVAIFKSLNNDIKNFGNFDTNFYCRPYNSQLIINSSYADKNGNNINKLLNLDGWKTLYQQDIHSNIAPVSLLNYTINNFVGNNKYPNGNFDKNIDGLYCYSAQNNCIAKWNNSNMEDDGALQISFSPSSANTNYGSVIIGIGPVQANKNYILRFNTSGFTKYSAPQIYLRQSQSPYKDLSARKLISGTIKSNPNEILLTAQNSANDASLVIDINDQANPVYLDNIQITQADISKTAKSDSLLFIYNADKKPEFFLLHNIYIDTYGKTHQDSITLEPFTSAILIKQSRNKSIVYNIKSP